METTAQKISTLLDDDGQVFESENGRTFDDLMAEFNADSATDPSHPDRVRYTFDDGSVITVSGDAWDFGYSDCFFWRGDGHAVPSGTFLLKGVCVDTHAESERLQA